MTGSLPRTPAVGHQFSGLPAAGLAAVTGYGEDGSPLTAEHRCMIAVAEL